MTQCARYGYDIIRPQLDCLRVLLEHRIVAFCKILIASGLPADFSKHSMPALPEWIALYLVFQHCDGFFRSILLNQCTSFSGQQIQIVKINFSGCSEKMGCCFALVCSTLRQNVRSTGMLWFLFENMIGGFLRFFEFEILSKQHRKIVPQAQQVRVFVGQNLQFRKRGVPLAGFGCYQQAIYPCIQMTGCNAKHFIILRN